MSEKSTTKRKRRKLNPKPSRPYDWDVGLDRESESEKALFKLAWMSVGISFSASCLALTFVLIWILF
tara:strand:+ start:71 stop:271 length:201 start_codon:yes stop_codon:yes gene_type:complete